MKNIKIFIAVAMSVMLAGGLSSCEKDNGGKSSKGKSNVSISLSYPKDGDKRAVTDPTTGTSVTTFSTGQIFFYKNDANKEITQVYNIVSGTGTDKETKLTDYRVNIADMVDGGKVIFPNVIGDRVYILGNKTFPTVIRGESLTTSVLDQILEKVDLKGGSIVDAVLAGDANIDDGATADDNKKADVTVTPISARIEIKKITETVGGYTFELEAIYINNYYQKMTVSGTSSDIKNNIGKSQFDAITYPDEHSTWNDRALAMAAAASAAPTTGKVWSYHIFPAKNVAEKDDNIPHIVIHMKNLTKGDTLIYPNYYLTIATYAKGTAKETKEFKAGNVYTIDNIEFNAVDHGSSEPEEKLVDCDVTVKIATWIANPLNPDVN